jgi:hypothetical protein
MKRPETKSLFGQDLYKRWFTLNHDSDVMRIATCNDAKAMRQGKKVDYE